MSKKILIVDDAIDFITIYKTALEAAGLEVITAMTGKEGMEKLLSAKPDVVILDVMMEMPDSGFDFMNDLRGKGNNTPVILCSSIADASQMNFDLNSLGANLVMQKPVDLKELVAQCNKLAG